MTQSEAVLGTGYHSNETLLDLDANGRAGVRKRIGPWRRNWDEKKMRRRRCAPTASRNERLQHGTVA